MALEAGTYINSLVATNPVSSDPKSQGDDHIRLIKSAILATWPNVNGAVTSSDEELNILDGATLSTAEINILDGATLSTAELNILDGATLSTIELNYVDGVTSAIQTQLNLKAPLASPTLTGTPLAPTAATGTGTTQIATTEFVANTSFSTNLPAQVGNAGKIIKTDGTNASWTTIDDPALTSGTLIVTTNATQTLTAKTLQTPVFQDSTDTTKKANIILSGITAGQNRSVTLADQNMTLFTPGMRLLSVVTASGSATVDVETTFDATYDKYIIEADSITFGTTGVELRGHLKLGGAYVTTGTYHSDGTGITGGSGASSAVFSGANPNDAGNAFAFTMHLSAPTSAQKKGGYMTAINSGDLTNPFTTSGFYNTGTGVLTGVRFFASSGTITTGNFRLYGLRKS